MVAQEIPRAGSIGRPRGHTETDQTRSVVNKIAVLCRRSSRTATRLMKSGADNLRLFARGNRVVDRFRAARNGDVGRRFGVAVDRLVSLFAERRHVLAINRR